MTNFIDDTNAISFYNDVDNSKPFDLDHDFIQSYIGKKPNFGFNGLGEFVFYRTYSRLKDDGTKESFLDTIKRVVEGCYEIQRRHCQKIHIPWDYEKAQKSAQEMFSLMWEFKFLPPGRGLWMMGTKFMWERGGASMNNCAFVSTDDQIESDPAEPFCFLMDMSMLGVGVGFDTKGAGKIKISAPQNMADDIGPLTATYIIPDSREGWVNSLRLLIHSYTTRTELGPVLFDYSQIRKPGSDIKGFGGKASGPGILRELHDLVRAHLDRKIGQYLSSVDITDLMNYIGRCVVAGNVRRCLPKGTLIHLKRGLMPIEDVQVGDLVLTSDGYYPVAENVYQGEQEVLTIKTQMGQFRCTDRHRIAVMTGVGEYEWKRAYELSVGDKMVFVDDVIAGTDTMLPESSELMVPDLTTDVAWFIGYIHGDGYVYPGRLYDGRKYHGASVMAPVNRDEYHDDIGRKIVDGFESFGFIAKEQPSQDNCRKIRVISRVLSHYFHQNFKQARQPLNVPECVLLGTITTRAAYLAGLLDSDGSTKNRPTILLSNVYEDFIRQVQTVYSSLGIPTKLKLRRPSGDTEQAKWELSLVGDLAINKFKEMIQSYSVKQLPIHSHPSNNDFGFPSEWINRDEIDYGRSWTPQSEQMTYNRALLCEADTRSLIPVEVEGIIKDGTICETYDLSVPDKSEFVAHGMLVHNTAEIAFGEPDDQDYCSMKNPLRTLFESDYASFYKVTGELYSKDRNKATIEDFIVDGNLVIPKERLVPAIETWNALNHHRWASNNSIFANVGMDYGYIGHQIASNGEPGLMWLGNMQDYGRMIDGRQPGIDGRVKGGNPCFTGEMRLFTEQGYIRLVDLWLGSGCQEYCGTDNAIAMYGEQKVVNASGVVAATKVYRTGIGVPVYRVKFSDRSYIDATASHTMIKLVRHQSKKRGKTYYEEERLKLSELRKGDMIPLNNSQHFGSYHDPAYAELAGWCIGDGSLSPKADGQVRAECTCYETDITEVRPKIQGLLHQLYLANNLSSNQNSVYAGWMRNSEHFDHAESRQGSAVLGRLLSQDGVRSGDKHNIPHSVWRGSKATIAAFIRGFASADGGVQINDRKGTISIRIKQHDERILQDCRLLLNQFGIASTVYRRHGKTKRMMNDGRGGKKLYNVKAGYELIISGIKQVRSFIDDIGFIQKSKNEKAGRWLSVHVGSNNSDTGRYVKVVSVEYLGEHDTYCLTEPADNRIVIEGYQVGQCLEQSLESSELCNLVETFPANHEDSDDYMRTLKFAYLYAKTVTLLPTHNPRTNQVTLRNRRIGLSQSGIVQAFAKFGRRVVLEDFCDAGYNEIRRWDDIYSEWLCVQKSIKVTSVKPSGTVSLVSGATPGIHHPEARTYWRRVRLSIDSPLVGILKKAGFHIEPDIKDQDRTVVVKFGVSDERVKSVDEVSIWEQMVNAVDYQRYWADNQVSCTIKFKPEESSEIKRVLEAFEDQLKGISFLPLSNHGYAQAPYEPCSAEEVAAYNSKIVDADYTSFLGEPEGSKYCDSDGCSIT